MNMVAATRCTVIFGLDTKKPIMEQMSVVLLLIEGANVVVRIRSHTMMVWQPRSGTQNSRNKEVQSHEFEK